MTKNNIDKAVQGAVMLLLLTLAYLVVSLTVQVNDLRRDVIMIEQRVGIMEYMEMYDEGEYDVEE